MRRLLLLLWFGPMAAQAATVNVCLDRNFWYPFTYTEQEQARGLHIDIVRTALTELGYHVSFHPLPWARCLQGVEHGIFDAVATVSYKAERDRYLFYPPNAATEPRSNWAVTQVKYIVVTAQPYQYQGDPTTIPEPVRVPRGYSVADDLRAAGLQVDDGADSDKANLGKLLRDRNGAAVLIPELVDDLSNVQGPESRLYVSAQPFISKAYFLGFSQRTKLNEAQRTQIWQRIVDVREKHLKEYAKRYADREN